MKTPPRKSEEHNSVATHPHREPMGRKVCGGRLRVTAMAALALGLAFVPLDAARADSISFSESWTESLDCYRECDPEFGCETFCGEGMSLSQTLNATLTWPALRYTDLSEFTSFSLGIGNLSVSPEELSSASSNKLVFPSYHTDDDTGRRRKVGQVVVSKRGDVVTISASYSAPESAIVADQFTDSSGAQSGDVNLGEVSFTVQLADASYERMVPYTAKTTVTHKTRRVDDYFSEEYDLSTVKVSGSTNWSTPTTTITHPTAGLRWSNSVVTVAGTVASTEEVAFVVVRVVGWSDPIPVEVSNGVWSVETELVPGANVIQAYCFDVSGSFSPSAIVAFRYVRVSPLRLFVDPNPAAGTVLGAADLDLLEEGVAYPLTAVPASNHLFEKWVVESPLFGESESLDKKLTLVHEADLSVTAYFVTNHFQSLQGSYFGLFSPTNETSLPVEVPRLGFFTLKLTAGGRFSGKITAGRYKLSFSGTAEPRFGTAAVVINASGIDPLTLYLEFDFENGSVLRGVITDEISWEIPLLAYRAASPEDVAPLVGKHTFLIPGADADHAATLPAGDGAGRFTVSAKGKLSVAGAAGDGTAFSQSVPLCKDTSDAGDPRIVWPFYASAKRGAKLIGGFVTASPADGAFLAALVHWIKQPNFSDTYYADGFDDGAFATLDEPKSLIAAPYLPPGRGTNAVDWTEGVVLIDGGNLSITISNRVTVALNKFTVVGDNPNQLTLKLTPGTGLLSGAFLHPVTGRKAKFKGAILQLPSPESAVGGGWFLGLNESGYINLGPAAP